MILSLCSGKTMGFSFCAPPFHESAADGVYQETEDEGGCEGEQHEQSAPHSRPPFGQHSHDETVGKIHLIGDAAQEMAEAVAESPFLCQQEGEGDDGQPQDDFQAELTVEPFLLPFQVGCTQNQAGDEHDRGFLYPLVVEPSCDGLSETVEQQAEDKSSTLIAPAQVGTDGMVVRTQVDV